jgi:ABC-type transport system involved in multi-copper enzyme maturation permease subunit
MLSLVWKDLVAARRLLPLVLAVGAVQVAVMSFVPGIYVMAALTFAAVLAFGSIAVEEYQRTELLWNSLPVRRGHFVTARYLTTLTGIVPGLALSWGLARTMRLTVRGAAADGAAALLSFDAHAVLFGLLLFAAALYLPLYFRFGAGRGLLLLMAIAVAGLILVPPLAGALLAATGQPGAVSEAETWRTLISTAARWAEPRFGRVLAAFLGSGIVALGVSLLLSRRLYQRRDL